MSRYGCVDDQKAAGFPVSAACEAAGVSTSGYYDWCARQAAGQFEVDGDGENELVVEVLIVHSAVTSVTAALAALSSTMEAPAA